ncbi:uncharacterized protein LOC112590924 isoform X1 [Melanaphis sacchari]|uniref:uncharacterized protein LOC112590924 isoform X1 n=1 Tax=Melanaphis sacchari TaxID=742174 RepID=UPI000DC1493C|nr:uncharacterized protein LOC112590924 isoform X1 [Melanaphis sacchari]
MVDTNRDNDNNTASKGILKRRIFVRNDKPAQATSAKLQESGDCCVANSCKRYVTFDEMITVKNDKDLVVKKPLKLELVIDNWKSNSVETHTEKIRPNSGIVRRLVDEFNTIEEKASSSKLINGKPLLHGRSQCSGRVNDLINMFNLKSTNNNIEEFEIKFIDF